MTDIHRILEDTVEAARLAGKLQLEYFRSPKLELETKTNDSDIVTIADRLSEKLIKKYLGEKYPGFGIISEESADENPDAEWRWVIDPLDGTTNFSQGIPNFCISIAVEHFGETVAGVVYAPKLNELFHAIKNEGAYFDGKKMECSRKDILSEAVVATGVPYDKLVNKDNNIGQLTKVIPLVRGVRRLGSAALDLCYVAAGFLDAYWELNLNHWDIAAGCLIARESGVVIKNIRSNRRYSILASSPLLIDQMVELTV